MAQMTPPPDSNDPGSDVTQVNPTTGERVMGALGGLLSGGSGRKPQDSPLDQAVAQHMQKRLDEAKMYRRNAATYAAALATGVNPQTGAPLTDEEKAQYQNWKDASWRAYEKSAGVNKETKAHLSKGRAILEHLIGHGQQQQQARQRQQRKGQTPPPQGGAGTTNTATPAATPAATPGTNTGNTGNTGNTSMTPPPGLDDASLNAGATRQNLDRQTSWQDEKRKLDLLHQYKMEEQKALQQAKGTNSPRPIHSGTLSVLDARKLTDSGQVLMGEDGNPIDLSKLDDTMGLYGVVRKDTDPESAKFGQWETVYEPISPNQRTVTVENHTYAVNPMDISKMTTGVGADLGEHNTPRTGTHDVITMTPSGPQVNTLSTTSQQASPGIAGRGDASGKTDKSSSPGKPIVTPGKSARTGAGAGTHTNATKHATGTTRAGTSTAGTATTSAQTTDAHGRPLGLPSGVFDQQQPRVTAVRGAATQIFGDPENPSFKPLSSYADIVDDPASRDRVASAWNLIRANMDRAGVEGSHGDLITLMKNYVGTPGAVAESEVAKMQGTLDALKPREAEMLNRLFSTYGTINGLRSITKASAAKFSARNMEQEVPIPGMNVRNSKQFYDKLATLAEEVNTGWKGVPDMMLSRGEREFDQRAQQDLADLASGKKRSSKGRGQTPPPGGSTDASTGTGMSVDEFKKKHGIK
jgi:hypothetical protein